MTDIAPIGRPSPTPPPGPRRNLAAPGAPGSPTRTGDRAEFSAAAQLLSKLAELPAIRHELVDRVRAQLAVGTYETPDKIDGAIDELIKDLA